jgi:sugar-specific transcriptional regulator TrmB
VKAGELVDRLTRFGLDERQAHVYFHLSRLGPSTASELAEATEVSRTEIYRVMDDLESLGFVETTLERPRKFVPEPVETVLDERIEERKREIDQLEETSQTLVDQWPRARQRDEARKERFSVHQGRSQVRGVLERMVDNADEEVLVLAPLRGLARLNGMGVLSAIDEATENGVSLRTLTEVEEPNEHIDAVREAGKVRHLDLPGYAQLVVVDKDEVALFVSLDPLVSTQGTGETVLWLNARDFILAQKALFDTLWSMGIAADERLDAVESDEPAERVEVIRGRWMRFERMKEMLHRAEERVRLMAPEIDLERWLTGRNQPALDRARQTVDEVQIVDPSQADGSAAFPHATVLEIDGSEVLFAMGVQRKPASQVFEGEWAVRLTTDDGVAHFSALFDRQTGR